MKNILIIYLLISCLFAPCSAAAQSDGKPVKLALVGTEATGDLAAILSASLSSHPGIVLVERSELTRLASEKQLQEFAAGDGVARAFDLLNADGLVVLEKAGRNGPLALRLFSTHNGIRLWSAEAPEKNPRELVKKLADTIAGKAPKCLLPVGGACPVAVINLRAATFSLANVELETKLTRLLEMQVDAVPGILLLERRRLGEAQFERDLSASVPESLQASVLLVDGSFVGGVNGEEISLNLRVRGKEGSRESKFKAKPEEISRLMQEMVSFISGRQGKADTLGDKEAEEFLQEALWADAHGMIELTVEAGEAAAALGQNSPGLWQLLARTYARLVGRETRFYNGKNMEPVPVSLQSRSDMILNALALCQKLEADKQSIPKSEVLNAASEFLLEMDVTEHSGIDVEKLRALLREMAPFDPSGKKEPYNPAYAADYAPVWAASLDDLLSFYTAYINSDHPKRFWVFKRLLRVPTEALGKRFLSEEEARKKLVNIGESWRVQPETELFGWMLLARHGTPEESAIAYRTYLNLLTERAVALEDKGKLGNYLQAEWNDDGFRKRFGRERAKGLLQLFGVSRQYNEELVKEWFGRGSFEPEEAKEVWAAQQAYRQRVLAALDVKEKSDHTQAFNWAEGVFLTRYPEAANPATTQSMNSIVVSRFWCAASGNNLREFGSNSIEVAGNAAWMMGGWNGQPGGSLIKISLPELRAQDYPTDISGTGGKITLAGEMIYVLHGEYPGRDEPMQFFLRRFDPALGKWEKRPFQDAYKGFFAKGKLYFNLWNPHGKGEDNGLLEYDWDTNQSHLLVSTRRKPAVNQLDASIKSRINGVFEGPDHKVWVAVGHPLSRVYIAQEEGGDWKEAMSLNILTCTIGEEGTLLTGRAGELVCVNGKTISSWLYPSKPGDFGWKTPPGWNPRWLDEGKVAFRPGELFLLARREDRSFQLRWYWEGGPPEGLDLPLTFQLPAPVQKIIAAISEQNPCNFKAEMIANPEKNVFPLKAVASRHGLMIKPPAHGFWFIPNADLEAKKVEWMAQNKEPLAKIR